MNIGSIPEVIGLIFKSAFSSHEAGNAFLGGTAGYAFLWGMKRALFSSEAGQGSSPIAHSAAKTKEPVREALVAGLEPFIDTIIVCTLTAMVILVTGAWNRDAETMLVSKPSITHSSTNDEKSSSKWHVGTVGSFPAKALDSGEIINADDLESPEDPVNAWFVPLPDKNAKAMDITLKNWQENDSVFLVTKTNTTDEQTGTDLVKVLGRVVKKDDGTHAAVFKPNALKSNSVETPTFRSLEVYKDYPGATLTAHAFDRSLPGFGTWLILVASWLFAISTMISWAYYGEQGMIYMFGNWSVAPYKILYCLMIIVATIGIMNSDADLDGLTALGTGVMLWANIPIMLVFGFIAMRAYHSYVRRLKAGEFKSHKGRGFRDMAEE
jgi:AGCS family alanine or glycine:cation symporter